MALPEHSERAPLLVAGMHRSGTSYVASLLARRGWDVGSNLIPSAAPNPRGYFEDADFVALHGEMLRKACEGRGGGWPDWGWVPDGWDPGFEAGGFEAAGRALLARREGPGFWGWKDPRTTLLLDFWKALAPGLRALLVFRAPWDVADSMRRLGDHPPLNEFATAVAIWTFYNRRLLDFHVREGDRCCVLSLEAATQLGQSAVGMALKALGLAGPEAVSSEVVFEPGLLTTRPVDGAFLADFSRQFPEAWELWCELNRRAAAWMPVPTVHPVREPKVTVVVPCRDHGPFLLESLPSVLANPEVPTETIIVNDGSTSGLTLALLGRLEAAGWRVLHQPPRGLSAARNAGIEAGAGAFVFPLDADNQLMPGSVAESLRVLEAHPKWGVVYGDVEFFGARTGVERLPDMDEERLHLHNFIDACALFRRTAWEEVGGYDPDFEAYEDWDFWLALCARGIGFGHLNRVTFRYRVRADSMVHQRATPEGHGALCEKLARKHAFYRGHFPGIIRRLQSEWRALHLHLAAVQKRDAARS